MNDKSKQPREYDLVLGGNNPPPTNGLVLGGIDGLKLQFSHAISEEKQIVILKQAIVYGDAGEAWLFDLIATEKNKIQWLAAVLLSHTKNEVYKQLLLEYFAEFIPNNVDSWNKYKQALPDLEINLSRINFIGKELHKIDFSQVNLHQGNFSNSYLYELNLFETNLSKVILEDTTFISSKIQQSTLESAVFSYTIFYDVKLDEVNLKYTQVNHIDFQANNSIKNVIFDDSIELDEVCFTESPTFHNVVFRYANLQDGYFSGSCFENIVFDNCNLINADFSYCRNFTSKAIFQESNLENAKFKFSNLKGVKFDRVNLKGADFRWSDLTGVDFTGLDISGANFTRCTFGNNNLDKANTEGAKFSSVDSPRFPLRDLDTSKLKGALFDDRHYYEPGYE